MKLEVKSTGKPCESEVLLDGAPIADYTCGVTLDLQGGEIPKATINLGMIEIAASVEVGAISYVLSVVRDGVQEYRKVRRVEFEDGSIWEAR